MDILSSHILNAGYYLVSRFRCFTLQRTSTRCQMNISLGWS